MKLENWNHKLENFRYQKSVFQVTDEYINFEAEADDHEEDEYVTGDINVGDTFIDDNGYDKLLGELYRWENVTRNAQDAINWDFVLQRWLTRG